MKIYKKQNVFEAALDRVRKIFDEFPNVMVSVSGGKDSTVVLNLALMVAREKNRLPLKVVFVDQEAEWEMAIDHIRHISANPEINLRWYQLCFEQMNASSTDDQFFKIWDTKKESEWIRPKEKNSIKELAGVTDRTDMGSLWKKISHAEFGREPCVYLSGVRCEESPNRFMSLTHQPTYKWITWGKKLDITYKHFTFYPIYDWSYTDVWKSIHDNKWDYCKLYDYFYRYGVSTPNMRVSSLNHAVGIRSLFYLQELEPKNYEKLVKRIPGVDTSGKMNEADFFIKNLPFMFKDWKEYRDYLLRNLITDSLSRDYFRTAIRKMDEKYEKHFGDKLYKVQISSIISNDLSFSKMKQWKSSFSNKEFDHDRRKSKAQPGS